MEPPICRAEMCKEVLQIKYNRYLIIRAYEKQLVLLKDGTTICPSNMCKETFSNILLDSIVL
jgi:hypothetical protein